ncbi:hypothetical protein F4802DRAFT_620715 [Xylaria palmicola]|nr:hypothetical protein F4802DRAFT_620715 [Xylaria palmicola]
MSSSLPNTAAPDGIPDSGYGNVFLGKKGTKIAVFIKVQEIETGVRLVRKTLGAITTENNDGILMSAHSGYSTNLKHDERCLDAARWNTLALRHIAKKIHFKFPTNSWDNGGRHIQEEHMGRFHAGHVEVLLASWYVVHLLRTEFDLSEESEEYIIDTQLKRLRGVKLGDKAKATITITSEPCSVCLRLLSKLAEYTGVYFMPLWLHGVGHLQKPKKGETQDIVNDVFEDSDDGAQGDEPEAEEAEEAAHVGHQTPVPKTPSTEAVRRPRTAWRHPQWRPEDREAQVSPYKKGTPVLSFPGYPSVESDSVTDWEDLSEDVLMMSCKPITGKDPPSDYVKDERPPPSSRPEESSTGQEFALAAYNSLRATIESDGEVEVVETRRRDRGSNNKDEAVQAQSYSRSQNQKRLQLRRIRRFRRENRKE